jgi:2-keto-3-deoxy-L-rhamnonate aldolase RhmA
LRSDEPALVVMLSFVNAGLAEYLIRLGFNCLMLDAEHGSLSDHDVEDLLRVCEPAGVTLIVHMPFDQPRMQRFLAMGVRSFHVAMIRSAAMGRAVVEEVKFPPAGLRGIGTFRAAGYGLADWTWPDFMAQTNDETFISLSVEDLDGFAAAPELVKIPEIDVIQVAASDLSSSLGVPGQTKHAKVVAAGDDLIAMAREAGKSAGVAIGSPAEVAEAYARGARFIIVSVGRAMRLGTDAFYDAWQAVRKTTG